MRGLRRRHLRHRLGHSAGSHTTLVARTYSEALDAYVTTRIAVTAERGVDGLRRFYVDGREVALQLPRGGVLPRTRELRKAEELHEVRA